MINPNCRDLPTAYSLQPSACFACFKRGQGALEYIIILAVLSATFIGFLSPFLINMRSTIDGAMACAVEKILHQTPPPGSACF